MSGAQAALQDVYDQAIDLLTVLARAHKSWAERQNITTGLKELAAMHVAFRVMLKTFPIAEAISDPDSLQALEALIADINPARAPIKSATKASA